MAMMEPLQNNVCLLSWAVACPWAFVLHLSLRTLARHARKRHALVRGKRVATAVSKGELCRTNPNDVDETVAPKDLLDKESELVRV